MKNYLMMLLLRYYLLEKIYTRVLCWVSIENNFTMNKNNNNISD